MKKIILLLLALMPFYSKSQSIKHSLFIAPAFSYYASSNSEAYPNKSIKPMDYWNFGAAAGYKLEYHFPKTFALGTSIEYVYTKAELNTPCYCSHPADKIVSISNLISMHAIDIPIYFKLKTNKNDDRYTFVQTGIGLSWLFNAYRNVEIVALLINNDELSRNQIAEEQFSIKNNNDNGFGAFFQLGIGRSFQIKQKDFFAELTYRQDLNSWKYKTIATPTEVRDFQIQRQSILLKIGFTFSKNKEKI